MSFETVASTVVVLAILIGLIAFLAFLKKKGKSFTFRVFTALGLGVVFGAGIQIVLGLGTDATKTALGEHRGSGLHQLAEDARYAFGVCGDCRRFHARRSDR